MPVDPTTDSDFMAAAPHDQMAYLSQTDPEFAKASPQDQMGYLMHIRGLGPVSGPKPPPAPDMQQVPVLNQDQQQALSPLKAAAGVASGVAKGLYDVSTPGMAMSVLREKFPSLADKIPLPAGGPVNQIPNKAAMATVGMMAGGLEAGEPSPGAIRPAATAPTPEVVAPVQGPSMATLSRVLARHIPIVGKVVRTVEDVQSLLGKDAPATPTAIAGAKVPVPETNGIQWGTGGKGPLDLRGKMIPPTPPIAGQDVPLPNITPTKAAVVDPYRNQILPPMTKGVSGNVEAHAYDPATQQMITHFKSGDIYKYEGIPPKVYDQFVNADSQGSFHYNNIRGRYATEKIGKVAPTRTRGTQVSQALGQGK